MIRLRRVLAVVIGVAVAASLFAWLSPASVAEAIPSPHVQVVAYRYDAPGPLDVVSNAVTERGPPAITYDHTAPHLAVDAAPYGPSACPRTATTLTYTVYDHRVPLVQVARGRSTTLTEAGDRKSNTRADLGARCAANTGRTAARACSFAGATTVLMADGTRKPIEDVKVGDEVIATDPETGEQVAKRVEHVFVHDDTVIDLVVEGEVITTTEDHPFWSVTDQRFERADELNAGEKVLGADGTVITVSGLRLGTAREALAYNLSVEGIHTYHVGEAGILVHNSCAFPQRPLPRDPNGVPIPDSRYPHTQLGTRAGRNGSHPQAREFGYDGQPVRDIDWTDHGRPALHDNPHQHVYLPNPSGGTPQRGPAEPLW